MEDTSDTQKIVISALNCSFTTYLVPLRYTMENSLYIYINKCKQVDQLLNNLQDHFTPELHNSRAIDLYCDSTCLEMFSFWLNRAEKIVLTCIHDI